MRSVVAFVCCICGPASAFTWSVPPPSRPETALSATGSRLQAALSLLGLRSDRRPREYGEPVIASQSVALSASAAAPTTSDAPSVKQRQVLVEPVSVSDRRRSQAPAVTSEYLELSLSTKLGISLHDLTPAINEAVMKSGTQDGWVNIVSRHTTTAVTLNECESRLMDDVRQFCLKLAPPEHPYLHNDIHLRPYTEDDKRRVGDVDIEAWRAQEPRNCHAHLLSMLLGNTLMLPISRGGVAIGRWQSIMMVELDGPRQRSVGVQITGFNSGS